MPMKLHLGCGNKYIPGYVHIDTQYYDHIDYVADISELPFIKDNSVEVIYVSHVLEHMSRHTYIDVLREWYRVLLPYGKLRIAVPDFDKVVYYYMNTNNDINKILGFLVGGQKNTYDYHNMVFNYDLLSHILYDIGFTDVYKYDWKNTEHSYIDDYSQSYLPHMDKDDGLLMSLNIEAVK
jgi:predicted SAM-dependent methyltransferase